MLKRPSDGCDQLTIRVFDTDETFSIAHPSHAKSAVNPLMSELRSLQQQLNSRDEIRRQLRIVRGIKGEDERLEELIGKWRRAFVAVLADLQAAAQQPAAGNSPFFQDGELEPSSGCSQQESATEADALSRMLGIDVKRLGFDADANAFYSSASEGSQE